MRSYRRAPPGYLMPGLTGVIAVPMCKALTSGPRPDNTFILPIGCIVNEPVRAGRCDRS